MIFINLKIYLEYKMEYYYIITIICGILITLCTLWKICLKDGWMAFKTKRDQLKLLGGIVSSAQKNKNKHKKISKCRILCVTFGIIFKTIWLTLLHKIHKNVKKIGRNTFEITYCVNGKIFKMVIEVKRGPGSVLQVIDENSEDVTEKVESYLNCNDVIIKKVSPVDLDFNSLTINFSNGESKTYEEIEKIEF